jgi:hypothetical protein
LEKVIPLVRHNNEAIGEMGLSSREGKLHSRGICFFCILKLLLKLLHMPLKGLHDLIDGDEVAILGNDLTIDWQAAMRTRDVLSRIDLKEFLHAGSTAAMLVHAHHYRSVLISIELP